MPCDYIFFSNRYGKLYKMFFKSEDKLYIYRFCLVINVEYIDIKVKKIR